MTEELILPPGYEMLSASTVTAKMADKAARMLPEEGRRIVQLTEEEWKDLMDLIPLKRGFAISREGEPTIVILPPVISIDQPPVTIVGDD
jgi:flavorubredoxin